MKPPSTTVNNGQPLPTRPKNAAAQALGRRGKNKPKTLTPAALQQRISAGFKRLPKATIAAAQAAAQDATTFQLPPGPSPADDAHYNDAE